MIFSKFTIFTAATSSGIGLEINPVLSEMLVTLQARPEFPVTLKLAVETEVARRKTEH